GNGVNTRPGGHVDLGLEQTVPLANEDADGGTGLAGGPGYERQVGPAVAVEVAGGEEEDLSLRRDGEALRGLVGAVGLGQQQAHAAAEGQGDVRAAVAGEVAGGQQQRAGPLAAGGLGTGEGTVEAGDGPAARSRPGRRREVGESGAVVGADLDQGLRP